MTDSTQNGKLIEVAPIPVIGDLIDLNNVAAIQATYDELVARPWETSDTDAIAAWVMDWSNFERRVEEAATLTYIELSRNNTDAGRKAAFEHYMGKVMPVQMRANNALNGRLIQSAWTEPGFEPVLAGRRAELRIFHEDNVDLLSREGVLQARYGEIVGAMSVEFNGEERTYTQLTPFLESRDRAVREAAWRAGALLFEGEKTALDALYDELFALRLELGANLGISYPAFRWDELKRAGYTEEDVLEFVRAVQEVVVPVATRRAGVRCAALGVEVLAPWDTSVDPYGDGPVRKPFETGDELAAAAQLAFAHLSPQLGDAVQTMIDGGLLDLMTRPGKNTGGYNTTLAESGRPYIHMNATGVPRDVTVMLHEAGHGVHGDAASKLPYMWHLYPGVEACELASTAMEAVAAAYMDEEHGGLLTTEDALKLRIKFFEDMIFLLPHIAVVTQLQHWAYAHPEHTAAERHAMWAQLQRTFKPFIDWDGNEQVWHKQLHHFEVPLYYVEYGISFLGAVQFYRSWLADPQAAIERYLEFIGLGNTRSLEDLYRAAGVELAFDAETLVDLMAFVEETIAGLEAELAAVSEPAAALKQKSNVVPI